MRHLIIPDSKRRRLIFYLAMEEWAARTLEGGFFCWNTDPTVIVGRNQDIEAEVNLEFCKDHGISVFRRKSGGGCVYSDEGNLMVSYIVPGTNVERIFAEYLDALAKALEGLGIQAVKTEHNDILVNIPDAGSFKVSGNAFFADRGMSIVHGTLLLDSDFSVLSKAITPSKEKLESHGVKSVRQRVVNLKEAGLDIGMAALRSYLVEYFCDVEYVLSQEDMAQVEEIEQTYLDPKFLKASFFE